MNRPALPFGEPSIRTFLDYAFMFGMRASSVALDRYVLNHYGNVCFVDPEVEGVYDPFDAFPAPRLRQLAQSNVMVSKGHDLWREDEASIEAFFKAQVDAGRYCLVTLDECFLPKKQSYQKQHFIHHNLVVGYDGEKSQVALAGYFQLGDRDYGTNWVSTRDFLRSFCFNSKLLVEDQGQEIFAVSSYKYAIVYQSDPLAQCELDRSEARDSMEGYLNSRSQPEQMKFHNKDLSRFSARFGVSVYQSMIEYMHRFSPPGGGFPIHAMRLLSEHKAFMVEKWDYWVSQNFLGADEGIRRALFQIRDLSRSLRLIGFKLLAPTGVNRENCFKTIESGLSKCRDLEEACYPQILRRMNQG